MMKSELISRIAARRENLSDHDETTVAEYFWPLSGFLSRLG